MTVALSHTGKLAGSGVLGNKGAVTVSFEYMGTRLAFTTAHFAAHQKRVKPRNDTFQEVCAETLLPHIRAPELGDFTMLHDVCFWCGDLNYRLELPRDLVISLVTAYQEERANADGRTSVGQPSDHATAVHAPPGTLDAAAATTACSPLHRLVAAARCVESPCGAAEGGDDAASATGGGEAHGASAPGGDVSSRWSGHSADYDLERPFAKLWLADQLRQEMAAGRVFTGWSEVGEEGPNFPPSYKYSKNVGPPSHATRVYGDEEGKKRVPSYTDRILTRNNRSDISLVTLEYTTVDTVLTSDHSPVRALLMLRLPLPALDPAMHFAEGVPQHLGVAGEASAAFGVAPHRHWLSPLLSPLFSPLTARRLASGGGSNGAVGGSSAYLPRISRTTDTELSQWAAQWSKPVELQLRVSELVVHLSPGAIASRALKEDKQLKAERKRQRELADALGCFAEMRSMSSVDDLVRVSTNERVELGAARLPSTSGVRFLGMRPSVRAAGTQPPSDCGGMEACGRERDERTVAKRQRSKSLSSALSRICSTSLRTRSSIRAHEDPTAHPPRSVPSALGNTSADGGGCATSNDGLHRSLSRGGIGSNPTDCGVDLGGSRSEGQPTSARPPTPGQPTSARSPIRSPTRSRTRSLGDFLVNSMSFSSPEEPPDGVHPDAPVVMSNIELPACITVRTPADSRTPRARDLVTPPIGSSSAAFQRSPGGSMGASSAGVGIAPEPLSACVRRNGGSNRLSRSRSGARRGSTGSLFGWCSRDTASSMRLSASRAADVSSPTGRKLRYSFGAAAADLGGSCDGADTRPRASEESEGSTTSTEEEEEEEEDNAPGRHVGHPPRPASGHSGFVTPAARRLGDARPAVAQAVDGAIVDSGPQGLPEEGSAPSASPGAPVAIAPPLGAPSARVREEEGACPMGDRGCRKTPGADADGVSVCMRRPSPAMTLPPQLPSAEAVCVNSSCIGGRDNHAGEVNEEGTPSTPCDEVAPGDTPMPKRHQLRGLSHHLFGGGASCTSATSIVDGFGTGTAKGTERPRKQRSVRLKRTRWWQPQEGDRLTAGLLGLGLPEDSFTQAPGVGTGKMRAGRTSIFSVGQAAAPGQSDRSSGHRGSHHASQRSISTNLVAHNSIATAEAVGVGPSMASCTDGASARGACPTAGTTAGVVAASHAGDTCSVTTAEDMDEPGHASMAANLRGLEELWGGPLLKGSFEELLALDTEICSLPLLRQQPLQLILQYRGVVACCRLDLAGLPPLTGYTSPGSSSPHLPPASELRFELPVVRNGLTVGTATGLLAVTHADGPALQPQAIPTGPPACPSGNPTAALSTAGEAV